MVKFDIKQDLASHKFEEQVEILYISGPTYGDVSLIARCLGLSVDFVQQTICDLKTRKGRRYDSVRSVR